LDQEAFAIMLNNHNSELARVKENWIWIALWLVVTETKPNWHL